MRNALLLLISEEPRNGYQLMQEIEQRSGGQWRPSPGSVYPALSQLEDEGLVRTVQYEGGRAYEITDAGREQVESLRDQAPPWQAEEEEPGERSMHALGRLIVSVGMAAWQVVKDGDESQIAAACEVLANTRRTLYGILADESPSAPQGGPQDAPGEAPPSGAQDAPGGAPQDAPSDEPEGGQTA